MDFVIGLSILIDQKSNNYEVTLVVIDGLIKMVYFWEITAFEVYYKQ